MIITVFGATGKVGKYIIQQALAKGNNVRAFVRNISALIDEDERNNNLEAIQGYVFDEEDVYHAINGTNAVLSVLGGSVNSADKTRSLGIKNIIKQMKKAGVPRIVALGGSGILSAPNGDYLINQPSYPAEFIPVGKEHLQAYLYLKESDLDWTFVCPPDIKDANATYQYSVSDTYPPASGNHYINAGDLADFMLKEAEQASHLKQRVGIVSL